MSDNESNSFCCLLGWIFNVLWNKVDLPQPIVCSHHWVLERSLFKSHLMYLNFIRPVCLLRLFLFSGMKFVFSITKGDFPLNSPINLHMSFTTYISNIVKILYWSCTFCRESVCFFLQNIALNIFDWAFSIGSKLVFAAAL